jgi:hypothetical protein
MAPVDLCHVSNNATTTQEAKQNATTNNKSTNTTTHTTKNAEMKNLFILSKNMGSGWR